MTVSSFPFKESESSLFTTVGRNLRPTCANPPPLPLTPLLLSISALFFGYSKSFISPPPRGGGAYLFQAHLRGVGLNRGGGLSNLETTMVSVFHKKTRIQIGKG